MSCRPFSVRSGGKAVFGASPAVRCFVRQRSTGMIFLHCHGAARRLRRDIVLARIGGTCGSITKLCRASSLVGGHPTFRGRIRTLLGRHLDAHNFAFAGVRSSIGPGSILRTTVSRGGATIRGTLGIRGRGGTTVTRTRGMMTTTGNGTSTGHVLRRDVAPRLVRLGTIRG